MYGYNMLFVKTKIGLSKINGIGLFADQFIPRGTLIWKFANGFDLRIDMSNLQDIESEPAREQFLKYAYLNSRTLKYVLCFDDARFFNHSENPNVIGIDDVNEEEGINIAVRDINKNEELTVDYKQYDADFDNKMKKDEEPRRKYDH